MKKRMLLLSFLVLCTSYSFAEHCFIARENGKIITQEGDCDKRYAPCSTFKITLSLIGYDSGILIDETQPVWSFKQGYPDLLAIWKQDQTPASWIKNSCVWYSQVLTHKLGMEKFKTYITNFNYGNMDLSGDKGKNNGLTNAWLSSSLEISGIQQVAFLEKLLNNELPVTAHAHNMTKKILFLEEFPNRWKLYGKTGSGVYLNKDRTAKLDIQYGWFVGWIEKDGRTIVFVNRISDGKKQETFAGPRAKANAKEKLIKIISKLK